MSGDSVLYEIEHRGYSRGVGHLIMPSGQLIAVSDEEAGLELNNTLARLVYAEWTA